MNILIAVPCFDTVHTDFFESFVNLEKPAGTSYTIVKNTLIYIARNIVAGNALQNGFDRVLWLDSDMTFPKDMILRLCDDMDEGRELVTGLYFTRRPPIKPNAFSELWWEPGHDGIDTGAEHLWTYPEDVVEIEACGMGCCMMSTDLIRRVGEKFGSPFTPIDGMGEDLAFCYRVKQLGEKMYCDTRIKCGHVGQMTYDEEYYKKQGIPEEYVQRYKRKK